MKLAVGTPFLAGGRDAAVGLDCLGLMLLCFRMHQLNLTEPPLNGRAPENGTFLTWLADSFVPATPPWRELDVVYTTRPRHHVAVFEDARTLLDTDEQVGIHRRKFERLPQGAQVYRHRSRA